MDRIEKLKKELISDGCEVIDIKEQDIFVVKCKKNPRKNLEKDDFMVSF